jgi:hypothetical protein
MGRVEVRMREMQVDPLAVELVLVANLLRPSIQQPLPYIPFDSTPSR